jgi:hypothetical protein
MGKRKVVKPKDSEAGVQAPQGTDALVSVLPMAIQVGDRFTEHGHEWEVLTHPRAMHGAKTLRARIVRPGVPETEREVVWAAHERVLIRRSPRQSP